MVLTPNDFDKEANLTIDDFNGVMPKNVNINNKTAAQISAASTITMSGSKEDYLKTKDKLLDPQSRQDFILEQQQLRDMIWEDSKKSLFDILSNDTISDEIKTQSLIASKIDVTTLPSPSTLDTLAEEAAISESGVNETERAATSRYNALDSIKRVNNEKRRLTSLINSLEIGKDETSLGKIKDVAELIAPFAEWIHYDQLTKSMTKESSSERIGMLGNMKKKLYDQVQNMSVEERAIVAEQIANIVQENSNVILPDGNDLVTLETLNRMLVDNDYSNAERYFDNITGLLDIIGVGATIRSLAKSSKGIKAANKSLTLAEEAQAFKNRPQPSPTDLEKEAQSFQGTVEPTADSVFTNGNGIEVEQVPTVESVFGPTKNTQEIPANDIGKSLAEEASNFKAEPEPTADTLFRKAVNENTRTEVSPSSPSQVVKDVNPEIAREIHALVANDETGEAATALYGSSKTEALAKDILPEPEIVKGEIPNKVEMRRPEFEEPADIKNARSADGQTYVSEKELTRVKERLIGGLEEVEGMVLHPSSLVVRYNVDGTLGFTARYSPLDSGFATADEALNNAEYAFRNYGLPREAFTILARQGDKWVETSLKEIEAKNILKASKPSLKDSVPQLNDVDYAIGLKYDYRIKPEDFTELDMLTTAPSLIARTIQFADRIPSQILASKGQGSLVQNLLDAASVIHSQIVNAASVAVDKSFGLKKLYVKQFEKFAKDYSKLSKERRALMTDYIHEANFEGLKLNTIDLYNRGFTTKEIETLKQWRRANDAMWHATNDDMVKTLRARGNRMFIHNGSDTKLVGRPIAKQSITKDDLIYDPVEGTNIKIGGKGTTGITSDFIDDVYEKGGEFVRLNQPIQIDGQWVDVVLSRNSIEGGFVRKIYDGETVLAYRDGYYPVMYDANYFITKTVKGDGGKEFTKVVASAKDKKELDTALDMLRKSEPDSTFSFRKDRSFGQQGANIFDEGGWSLSSNAGLSTQRFRGERLSDSGLDLQKSGYSNLKDPLEAVAKQIHSLSQRVSMRDYMDATKNRWMQNYGDYLILPRNKMTGKLEMPKSPSQIVGKPDAPQKMVADARTNYNYIYSLENGYINQIDELYRGTLHAAADFMGELGLNKFERGLLDASRGSPTQKAKTVAFRLFLSASPLRQAVIQRGQILQLGAINPKYLAKGLVKDLIGIRQAQAAESLGLKVNPKYAALYDEFKNSGVLEAVDAHNLIREDLLHLADISTGQKAKTVMKTPLNLTQKVGFDWAEQDNLISSWLAHRDLAVKAGKDLKSQRVKDEVLGQARAYTLNMNRAGEMPYSQNTLGLVAQFMSFRHKAFLQPFTNRSLTGKQKAQLLFYTSAMFGIEATAIGALVDKIFDKTTPNEVKDTLKDGLLDTTLNAVLTQLSGKDQNIDFGDLAPVEAYGMWNTISGALSTSPLDMMANSPAGSLLFGGNPRLTDAFRTLGRYFNVLEDYEDPELQTTFVDVTKATLSTFSGASAIFKAHYAYLNQQKLSSYGRITDNDVTSIEALASTFGFRTKTETGYQATNEVIYGDKSGNTFTDDDITSWYKELKRQLSRRGTTPVEDDMVQRVYAEAWRVFNEDRPRAITLIEKEMEKDARNGDYVMFMSLYNKMGLWTEEELMKAINKLPDNNVRDKIMAVIKIREEMLNGD